MERLNEPKPAVNIPLFFMEAYENYSDLHYRWFVGRFNIELVSRVFDVLGVGNIDYLGMEFDPFAAFVDGLDALVEMSNVGLCNETVLNAWKKFFSILFFKNVHMSSTAGNARNADL